MAQEGRITFDEYYDLFNVPHLGNPWNLIKYYLLSDIEDFKAIDREKENNNDRSSSSTEHCKQETKAKQRIGIQK